MNSKKKNYREPHEQSYLRYTRTFTLISNIKFVVFVLFVVNILLFSCSTQKLPVREISIERDGIILAVVKAEIAETQEERTTGLMYRKKLPDGRGMLFIFENDQILSFWMKNTYIPLSIAYITWDGKITDIKDMYPQNENSISSSRSVRYALEVPQGWFERKGIQVGDTVRNLK